LSSANNRHVAPRHDRNAWLVGTLATILSIAAFIVALSKQEVLRYSDAVSHLLIARRVVDSPTPGLTQLGSAWLPLPHILMIPFIWINPLYQDGLAGSISSMAAFVVGCVFAYKIAFRFTGKKIAGGISAATYGLCFSLEYLQATPMTESLLFGTMLAAVYFVLKWADTRKTKDLLGGAAAAMLATLSRYEAWPVAVLLLISVGLIAAQQHVPDIDAQRHRRRTWDRVRVFAPMAIGMIFVGWPLWNQIIFGNALDFQDGAYSHPPLGSHEPAIGNWWITIKTYYYAAQTCVGLPVLVLGALGLIVFLWREFRSKQRAVRALPILALLGAPALIIASIYDGQRPLHVVQITGEAYNVRYGLAVIPVVALLVGYLTTLFKGTTLRAALSVVALATVIFTGITSMENGINPVVGIEHASTTSTEVVTAFNAEYNGGLVLMESWGNEYLAYKAIPSKQHIDEGSYRIWQEAQRNPAGQHIQWIIMRGGSDPDELWQDLGSWQLAPYKLVYQTSAGTSVPYRIYELKA